MKKAERILLYLLAALIFLVYCRIPPMRALFFIVCMIATLFYLFGSVFLLNNIKLKEVFTRRAYSATGIKEITMSILTGISLFQFFLALLSLVNDWPLYQTYAIVLGAFGSLAICIVINIVLLFTQKNPVYRRIMWRLVSAVGILLLLVLLNTLRNDNWI